MTKKLINPEPIKARIIIHVLDLIERGKPEDKKKALEELSEFASFYKIPLRHKALVADLKQHLREFILNEKGYISTISNLFNSLSN